MQIEQNISRLLARLDEGDREQEDIKPPEVTEEPEEYDVYVEPDRITVIKRPEPQAQIIETIQPPQPHHHPYVAYIALTISLSLIFYLVTSAFITTLFPPVITVTIMPTSHALTLSGTLQLGRLLTPVTISQSQIVPTTGKGHQDARSATGSITFYNGQFTSVTIPTGIILTSASGIRIITDQDAIIPAANPPLFGQATVSAHAIRSGSTGNIAAYDINEVCCTTSVLAKNTQPFIGGQDERNFQTVATADITRAATPLKTTVAQSMQGALHGQVTPQEQLQLLPCTPIVTSDHQEGEEAATVTVTASETCSAAAYSSQLLKAKATALLSAQAGKKLGPEYSSLGTIDVTVLQAIITRAATPPVFLSFHAHGTWVYVLNEREQQHMKYLIAGKTKSVALRLIRSLPGIEEVLVNGIDDLTKLPKVVNAIHVVILEKEMFA